LKYIIDRFEDGFAVCENEQGTIMNIEIGKIPKGTKEGDVICITDTGINIDIDATKKRKSKIEELAKNLWVD
jgi:hypothetical protein